MSNNNENLQSQYLRTVAQIKDLQEQITVKNRQRRAVSEQLEAIEYEARELAEMVAYQARVQIDPEMNTQQAADRARGALKTYTSRQRDQMQEVIQKTDERQQIVTDLQHNLAVVQSKMKDGGTKEDLQNAISQEEEDAQTAEAVKYAPEDIRKDAESGIASIVVKGKPSTKEVSLYQDAAFLTTNAKPKTIAKRPREEEASRIRKNKESRDLSDSVSDEKIDEIIRGFKDIDIAVMEAIGGKGFSELKDIAKYVMDKFPKISKNATRASIKNLAAIKVIIESQSYNPFMPNFYVYYFGAYGKKIYKKRFGTNAVSSEAEEIKREHDNLEHGYGIKKAAGYLQENAVYDEVIWMNGRKAIDTGKQKYIPDIWCKGKDGRVLYLEYERGETPQKDFNSKCSKMAENSDTLDFIVPNDQVREKMEGKFKKWFDNRGGQPKGKKIRMITAKKLLLNTDLFPDENWTTVIHCK